MKSESKVLISIVIPVYNCEKYLKECFSSISKQSFLDYEVVIIDDHSTDNSFDFCREYCKNDKRFRVYTSKGTGVACARNYGISLAKGKYILFIDADDYLTEDALSIFKSNIDSNCDLCIGTYISRYVLSNETVYHKSKAFQGRIEQFIVDIDYYINNTILQGPCWKAFRIKIIKDNDIKFPEELSYGEDASFVYDYLSYAHEITAFDRPVYVYNLKINSLSNSYREDKLVINLMLNKKVHDLKQRYSLADENKYMQSNVESFISYVNDVGLNSVENPISVIKRALSNSIIIESLQSSFTGLSFKRRMFLWFAKRNNAIGLYALSKLNTIKERHRWF